MPSMRLKIGSIIADFVLLFILIIPFIIVPSVNYLFGVNISETIGQTTLGIISLLIAVGLEMVTQAYERRTKNV